MEYPSPFRSSVTLVSQRVINTQKARQYSLAQGKQDSVFEAEAKRQSKWCCQWWGGGFEVRVRWCSGWGCVRSALPVKRGVCVTSRSQPSSQYLIMSWARAEISGQARLDKLPPSSQPTSRLTLSVVLRGAKGGCHQMRAAQWTDLPPGCLGCFSPSDPAPC